MLSGSFRSYPISTITVAPDRQRKDFTGIEELASSIRQLGLLHPIILSPEGVLVAGERRLRAHEHLGLTHILVQFTNELPEEELELIELEENVKRKSLTWREETHAVARIHELKCRGDASWLSSDTAALLSTSNTRVRQHLLVEDYLKLGETLVCNADTFSAAHNICMRKEQRAEVDDADAADAAFEEVFGQPISFNPMSVKSGGGTPELPLSTPTQPPIPYLHASFLEWATTPWTGPKFNFIHCDFPYGINFDKHNGGAAGLLGGYKDTPELYQLCIQALGKIVLDRTSESAHLMFWLSARHEIVAETMTALTAMGWKMNPVPLIWHRSDNAGIMPDPQRGPRQVYEVCLFGSLGDRKVVQPISNLFAHPKTKEVHASEKPRAMLQHFFRMFVDESTVMLDPTMGSGNSILAAEESEPKFVLGIEALEEIYHNALAYRNRVKSRG